MRKFFILTIIFLVGTFSSDYASAKSNGDEVQEPQEISVSYAGFEEEDVPIYQYSKESKGKRIAIRILESGNLFIDAPYIYKLYDGNHQERQIRSGLMEWMDTADFVGEVKKGETYYLVVPEKVPEPYEAAPDNFSIRCYLYQKNIKEMKPDTSLIRAGGRKTYTYFSCKKTTWIKLHVEPVFLDYKSDVWFVVQKKKGNKWETITEKQFAESDEHAYHNFEYGLVKGSYRVRVKCPKGQFYYLENHVEKVKRQKNVTQKKATVLTKKKRQMVLLNDKNKSHWYKVKKRSGNKKIRIQTTGTTGSVHIKVYRYGDNQAVRTVKMLLRRGKRGIKRVHYVTKTVTLPKEAGTYYVCVTKNTKKTMGEYTIKLQ